MLLKVDYSLHAKISINKSRQKSEVCRILNQAILADTIKTLYY